MQQSKWDRGISYISKGADKHEAGDKEAAAEFYERGIQLLLDHVKSMPQSERKLEKQQTINTYLTLLADLRPQNKNKNKNQYKRQNTYPENQYKQNKMRKNSNNNNYIPRKNNIVLKKKNVVLKKRSKHNQELFDRIENEIIANNLNVTFDDVIGLDNVKQALLEAVILPAQRPDIFIGPRAPPKGLLLFGPPGNGKTFIAKALATECNATFFCISSSSLTSRYVGEGEKLVRALFECARERSPSIIFIDEIDSLLSARGGKDEQESSRRMKTEFLIQFDGVQSGDNDQERVLLVGATNLPWQLDDAALRRFPKRILVGKPDNGGRGYLIKKILNTSDKGKKLKVKMSNKDINEIIIKTDGYSASDIKNLCNDAAMGPIREIGMDILNSKNVIPPITIHHFRNSLDNIKPSTTKQSQLQFYKWNKQFGTVLKVPPKKKHKKNSNNNYEVKSNSNNGNKKKESNSKSWISTMFE